MPDLLPVFLNLTGRAVVLVGGGGVASGKLDQLVAAGARVRVVAPEINRAIENQAGARVELLRRPFEPADLDGAWFVIAAATPSVNKAVAAAAEARHVFVNAVDDPPNASAFLSGVVRRDGATIAISTSGDAPALTALVREGLDAVLPRELGSWMNTARNVRAAWRRNGVPMDERKPLLLRALNEIYGGARPEREGSRLRPHDEAGTYSGAGRAAERAEAAPERNVGEPEVTAERTVPWLNSPEDSWP
jgi:siroheme synthase-like protein